MKKIICTLFLCMALQASNSVYYKLAIDPNSVKVIKSSLIFDGYHKLQLEFKILPETQCQEQFTGLYDSSGELEDPTFDVLYEFGPMNCSHRIKGTSRLVQNTIMLNVRSNHSMTINGVIYRFTGTGDSVQIKK